MGLFWGNLLRYGFWLIFLAGMYLWAKAVYLFCKNTFYLGEWREVFLEAFTDAWALDGMEETVCGKCGHADFDAVCRKCGESDNLESVPLRPETKKELRKELQKYIDAANQLMGVEK